MEDVITLLDAERRHFLDAVESVPMARRGFRRSPDTWSVNDIVEHVAQLDVVVTKLIVLCASDQLTATPDEIAAARLDPARRAAVRDRTRKLEAPERVRPRGNVAPEDVLAHLAGARAALKDAYAAADPALLDTGIRDHPFLGPLTISGWVELLSHHDARHAMQIAELAHD